MLATFTQREIANERRLRSLKTALVFCQRAGIALDDWQREFVLAEEKRLLVLAGRQSGKTACASLKALLIALRKPGSDVLICAPTARQSAEMIRRTKHFLGYGAGLVPEIEREAVTLVEFANKSRVIALPGLAHTIRGYSPAAVVIDEAAFINDDVIASVSPMLAVTGGSLILISSAGEAAGFFYEAFAVSASWRKWSITAADNPRITPEFLESEAETLPHHKFRAEYFNEFQSQSSRRVFTDEDIRAVAASGYKPELDFS